MPRILHRFLIRLADQLRFSATLRRILYFSKLVEAASKPRNSIAAVSNLCAAARLADSEGQIREVEKRIACLKIDDQAPPAQLIGENAKEIRKAAILKPYNQVTGEPGVVFISFEYEWAKLLGSRDLEEFAKRYLLVVSPTWTPPHSPVNCLFPKYYPAPVYCLISNLTDLQTFPRISHQYQMIELFASSWVRSDLFKEIPNAEKDIDLIMLANFGAYKRHHALFQSIPQLPADWRIVLVGQPNGSRTSETILAEAEVFGVRNRVELKERVSDEEVCSLLSRSKISTILSKREGSCVAVVESMIANTPVALLKGAQIGSAAFINDETGAFVHEKSLAQDLQSLHKESSSMNPRDWCLKQGIDAEGSSQILNRILAESSSKRGLPWTRDIEAMHWRPNPSFIKDSSQFDWLNAELGAIEELTGIDFRSPN